MSVSVFRLLFTLFSFFFFFSSRRRHTRFDCDWSSDVCSSDLVDARQMQALLLAVAPHAARGGEVQQGQAPARLQHAAERGHLAAAVADEFGIGREQRLDRKSTRLNSSHSQISYAVFCLKKKKKEKKTRD